MLPLNGRRRRRVDEETQSERERVGQRAQALPLKGGPVGPGGVVGTYRKVHLPWLGVDRFVSHGDRPFEILEVEGVRIGMLICYDGGFPEAVRCLALAGADLIVLPTNWPPGAEQLAEYTGNSRALENSVYFLAANRVGSERGYNFIGWSRICDPSGRTLATANHTNPCVIRAEIDTERSRRKRIVRVPGEHIIDRLADRRPEMYGLLCEPHSLPRPGRDDAIEGRSQRRVGKIFARAF